MSVSYTRKEIQAFRRQCLHVQQELASLAAQAGSARQQVVRQVRILQQALARETLDAIPVEELNRQKSGLRIRNLEEAGYDTVGAVRKASMKQLEAVPGISAEGAGSLKETAARIEDEICRQTRIRINADQKTPEQTQLLQALYVCRRMQSVSRQAGSLHTQLRASLQQWAAAMEPAENSLGWLFLSSDRKQAAQQAAADFVRFLQGPQGRTFTELQKQAGQSVRLSDAEVWQDYSQHAAEVLSLLAALVPGCLAEEEENHGLPEELAGQVQAQELQTEGLKCTLRPYQKWGVKYILKQEKVLLGDEMGLGKTVEAIAAMVCLHNAGRTHFLVVCPASVLTNWCRETEKMSTLTAMPLHGDAREENLARWLQQGGVAVTTYESTGMFQLEEGFKIGMLVVDEAHYIKNAKAQRTQRVQELCTHTDRILFMTGTALENNVEEMVSLIRYLRPEIAGTVRGVKYLAAAPEFRKRIAGVYYRRRREDVLSELPDLIETPLWVSLGKEEKKIYITSVLKQKYTETRRVSWNVGNLDESAKAQALLKIIEDAEEDKRKILVFSFFLDTLAKIAAYLGSRCVGVINGSVPPQKRQELVDQFQNAPAGAVLAAQITAGGTGLNIQSASVVVICEPQFKPSSENQAISRAYRMGQTRNVEVFHLLAEHTVDERLMQVLEEKQKAFDAFADRSEAAEQGKGIDSQSFKQIVREEKKRIESEQADVPVS